MPNLVVILGSGYTGRYLAGALTEESRRFAATSREPDRNLAHFPSDQRIRFDLTHPETWPNVPQEVDLLWCFPAAPIDQVKPRVQGEEFLRMTCGAIVLRVAGIYGPGRNPLDWIRSGRVGPSRKYVNLIHVEDLAAICLAALEQGRSGEVYNVSDGTPRTWEEVCRKAHELWHVISLPRTSADDSGKRVDTGKLTKELGVRIQHPDLYRALEQLKDQI